MLVVSIAAIIAFSIVVVVVLVTAGRVVSQAHKDEKPGRPPDYKYNSVLGQLDGRGAKLLYYSTRLLHYYTTTRTRRLAASW